MLSTLCKYKYCTREVEQCIHKLYKGRDHKRINKVISFIMKDKMEDSEKEVRKAKSEYSMATEEYRRAVEARSAADVIFVNIMKTETEKLWTIVKRKNKNKINTIMRRRKRENKKLEPRNQKKDEMKW